MNQQGISELQRQLDTLDRIQAIDVELRITGGDGQKLAHSKLANRILDELTNFVTLARQRARDGIHKDLQAVVKREASQLFRLSEELKGPAAQICADPCPCKSQTKRHLCTKKQGHPGAHNWSCKKGEE